MYAGVTSFTILIDNSPYNRVGIKNPTGICNNIQYKATQIIESLTPDMDQFVIGAMSYLITWMLLKPRVFFGEEDFERRGKTGHLQAQWMAIGVMQYV